MTGWDEKAEDYSGAHHTYEHLPPEMNDRLSKGFILGARWQRDELRADEAVDRVARSLSSSRQCGDCDRGYSPEVCGECWKDAVAAIDALLGDPTNPAGSVE